MLVYEREDNFMKKKKVIILTTSILAIGIIGSVIGSFKYIEAKNLEAIRLEEKATQEALDKAKEQVAQEVAERDRLEEEARLKAEEEARIKAEEEAKALAEAQAAQEYNSYSNSNTSEMDAATKYLDEHYQELVDQFNQMVEEQTKKVMIQY